MLMVDSNQFKNLYDGFRKATQIYPDNPALWVDGQIHTYADLETYAARLASAILAKEKRAIPLAAVMGYRSFSSYATVLGVLAAGKGYVPLNPTFPPERLRRMLTLSGVEVLVASAEALELLGQVMEGIQGGLVIICPDEDGPGDLAARFPAHTWLGPEALDNAPSKQTAPTPLPGDTAYLLFTSGSTGIPKGVAVSQGNVSAYLRYTIDRYQVVPQDRLSQTFDLTFDLSVHDLFVSWWSGACLYAIPRRQLMGPGKFIRDYELTMWFSVPSLIMLMAQMRMLKTGLFPSLRWSLFCGEPLPAKSAALWQEAANNSILENLYGPTEATIAISNFRWDQERSPAKCRQGVVPIGWAFEGQRVLVADSHFKEVAQGSQGELMLAGSQVTGGYLNNPEKTAAQFVRRAEDPGVTWYRTGDLVEADPDGCLYYLGRVDNQVQVRGYRVELQEIDHALREASGSDLAVSVSYPPDSSTVEAIYGFVSVIGAPAEDKILAQCRVNLPDYMVPERVFLVDSLPRNVNGKIDRKALSLKVMEMIGGTKS
jgi:amino acid adenylation domain-containing protein